MVRTLGFFCFGVLLMISGILVLDTSFYAGVTVIGVGAVLAIWFNMQLISAVLRWSIAKGEETRKKNEPRKSARR